MAPPSFIKLVMEVFQKSATDIHHGRYLATFLDSKWNINFWYMIDSRSLRPSKDYHSTLTETLGHNAYWIILYSNYFSLS
jgi:hypothetical protein